jgi:hypothetical protein
LRAGAVSRQQEIEFIRIKIADAGRKALEK